MKIANISYPELFTSQNDTVLDGSKKYDIIDTNISSTTPIQYFTYIQG